MDVGPMINTYLVKSFPGDTASRLHGHQGAKTTLTKSQGLDLSKTVAIHNCLVFRKKKVMPVKAITWLTSGPPSAEGRSCLFARTSKGMSLLSWYLSDT